MPNMKKPFHMELLWTISIPNRYSDAFSVMTSNTKLLSGRNVLAMLMAFRTVWPLCPVNQRLSVSIRNTYALTKNIQTLRTKFWMQIVFKYWGVTWKEERPRSISLPYSEAYTSYSGKSLIQAWGTVPSSTIHYDRNGFPNIYWRDPILLCRVFFHADRGRPIGFLHESFSSTVRLAVRNLFFIYPDHRTTHSAVAAAHVEI